MADNRQLRIEDAFDIKARHLPPSIFKFRGPDENAFRNLQEGEVWLASPDSYNDPFDSAASLSAEELYKRDRGILPERLRATAGAFLNDTDWLAIDAAADPMREFSRRMLECEPRLDRAAIPAVLDALESVGIERTRDLYAPLLATIRDGLKVCSFSASREPILMWSHYAAQHQGFCLEYEVQRLPALVQRLLFPVIYREEMFDATRFHLAAAAEPSRFNNIYGMLQPLFKAPDWSYEQEWRLVFSAGTLPQSRPYAIGRPSAVYLGARSSSKTEARVREVCRDSGIALWRMHLSSRGFRLEAEAVE